LQVSVNALVTYWPFSSNDNSLFKVPMKWTFFLAIWLIFLKYSLGLKLVSKMWSHVKKIMQNKSMCLAKLFFLKVELKIMKNDLSM
jgi:hypothetical protein